MDLAAHGGGNLSAEGASRYEAAVANIAET